MAASGRAVACAGSGGRGRAAPGREFDRSMFAVIPLSTSGSALWIACSICWFGSARARWALRV